MDNIVHPEMRRWISPEMLLREEMEAVIQSTMELGLAKKFAQEEAQSQIIRQEVVNSSLVVGVTPALIKLWDAVKAQKDEDIGNPGENDGMIGGADISNLDPVAYPDPDVEIDPTTSLEWVGTMAYPDSDSSSSSDDDDDDDSNANDTGIEDSDLDEMAPFGGGGGPWGRGGGDGQQPVDSDDEPLPEPDLGNDESDTLDKWLKLGLKSGPHRLLSGDHTNKKFASFMNRAHFEKTLAELKFAEEDKQDIKEVMDITERTFQKLEKACSPALGAVRGESFKDNAVIQGNVMPVLIPPIPDADKIELKCIGVLLCSTNPTGPIWRSNNVQQQIDDNLKLSAEKENMQNRLRDYADGKPGLVDNSKDFLVEVSVFCGRNPDESLPADVKLYTEPKLVYKLHLLGTNTVAELRAAIHCDNELVATAEVQDPNDLICRDEIFKHKILTWVFLIGNQIYGEGTDITAALMDWVNEKPAKNLGPFLKGDNKTMLKDLTLRFGYPYVYIHVGKCEHVIVFNQARMIGDSDEYRIEKYPVMASIPNLKNVFCRVDNEHMATWSVMNCSQFPENPMLICTKCLRTFCYNHDGTKRLPFRLYPFRQLANEI